MQTLNLFVNLSFWLFQFGCFVQCHLDVSSSHSFEDLRHVQVTDIFFYLLSFTWIISPPSAPPLPFLLLFLFHLHFHLSYALIASVNPFLFLLCWCSLFRSHTTALAFRAPTPSPTPHLDSHTYTYYLMTLL